MRAKCELQEGRMNSSESRQNASRPTKSAARGSAGQGASAAKALELRRLVQKKERLKYAVERLELQSTQRERQLRKSMAFQ